MDRVLLLMTTATYRAGAFLEAAGRLGLPVVVGSERPQALAPAAPAGNLTLDFLAPEEATRAIVKFAEEYPIRAVVSADDDGAVLAVMASAALGLPHNPVEAVKAARDKHRMREILVQAGIPSPRFERFSVDEDPAEIARRVSYPCVVKPLSLSASRGVIRADDPGQFVKAFRRIKAILLEPDVGGQCRSAQSILVESFIPGMEVAVESLLAHGTLKVLAIFDKPDPLDGPFFEETIYVTPSRLPDSVCESLSASTARVAEALGLREGPIHAELRVNEQGPWILEIAPRSIGGLCSRTLRFEPCHLDSGRSDSWISLEDLILRHAVGLDVDSFEREPRAAGVMMIPIPKAGILREVRGQEEARSVPGIEEIRLTIPVGQEVVPPPEGKKYLGFIFARDESPAGVEAALREAHDRLAFNIA